ncbi:unnamed protein product [Brassica rapa]|uniref:S-adenosylmethionine transporter n=1 Tax=Brassica campestris TaxID=3711 RepID=A0A3P6BT62_BRACM|nr:unnamed protein product [Brassica rapa]VDD05966.1 unnamed protein product [Brassica rapa]
MAHYFILGLVGPLRPIEVKRNSFNQTIEKAEESELSALSPPAPLATLPTHPLFGIGFACNEIEFGEIRSEKLLMAPLTLSVDVKSSSASAPDVSSRVIQIPQIKKSKGFASVSTQNENENPFDFFRTLFEGFIAGGTAGVVVETALYPIDTIKTRLQAPRGGGKIVLKGLYSGLAGNIAGVLPASALFVGVYEPTKQKLLKTFPDHLSAVAHLTAGAIGGLAASLIRVPTEVVKQRMQTGQFASAPNAVRVIASQEGFKGLYAGYRSFLLRDLPFDAIQFCIYEQLCLGYKKAARRELNDPENALIGAFAGALTGAVTTPLDVIKTRLMVQGSAKQYQGIVDCVQTIVKEEGASALLKGIGPRVLWIGIGGSIFFGVLESTKRTLSQRRPKTVKESKED